MKITAADFERSLIVFKEALYDHNLDRILVEEILNFYQTLQKEFVYSEEAK
jgi:hypothetical protein